MGAVIEMSATGSESAQDDISFADFWALYPRRVCRKDAARAWGRIHPREHVAIVTALVAWTKVWERRGEIEYVPHASTWLNGERWTDELPSGFTGYAVAAHKPAKLPERGERAPMTEEVRALIAQIRSRR